jgi:hypothetical protein
MMAGPLLTVPAMILCPHGAPVLGVTPLPRVRTRFGPAVAVGATGTIAACPAKPPCRTAVWRRGLSRVRSRGRALVDCNTPGDCLNDLQMVQGPTRVVPAQTRVRGR